MQTAAGDSLLFFERDRVAPSLFTPRGHRAIGVVYHPEYERFGNYVPTVLPRRYDALAYLERTEALAALPVHARHERDLEETHPFGV